MVNNREMLDQKIKKNHNNDFGLVSDIIGIDDMDSWFQNMLNDMDRYENLDEFLQHNVEKTIVNTLELRFHQRIIVDTTYEYLTKESDKRRKFIWGAVPRSGKSYMIGGLISKRHYLDGTDNNILIIMGARTETEKQFEDDLFKKFSNFQDYNIITSNTKKIDVGKKNIFLLSQELFKANKDKKDKTKFKLNEDFCKKYNIFEKNLDIYFDEIHKGAQEKNVQKDVMVLLEDELTRRKLSIDLFVMVTATYAKPTIAYNNYVDNNDPIILNWSYMDQQNMTQFASKHQLLKDSRENLVDKEVIERLLQDYQKNLYI